MTKVRPLAQYGIMERKFFEKTVSILKAYITQSQLLANISLFFICHKSVNQQTLI